MINKEACQQAIRDNRNLSNEDRLRFSSMCKNDLSIGALFEDEIPKHGSCTLADAKQYIAEEEEQMRGYFGGRYDMHTISVPEHILNEDVEGEHNGLPKGYTGVSGDVKFFLEWLEGHHPALACYFGGHQEVPGDEFYQEMAKARMEARGFR